MDVGSYADGGVEGDLGRQEQNPKVEVSLVKLSMICVANCEILIILEHIL